MESIVSSAWLAAHLNDADLIILDASVSSTVTGHVSEHNNTRIKGARAFDLKNDFSDSTSSLPNTMPSVGQFQESCRKLGINNSSKIVVYDNLGVYWSPRVWWMFKAMGHEKIAVLDGGLPDWMKSNYPISEKYEILEIKKGDFTASFQEDMIEDFEKVYTNTLTQEALLIDARSKGRFDGTEPEPRKDLRSGHIPNSVNIPYETVLNNGKFKSKEKLEKIFKDLKSDKRPLIFSCGSGITACIVLLASTLVLDKKNSVYDGSWTEWAQKVN